jgi:hypothetical protein
MFLTLLQSQAFRNDQFRRFFGLPTMSELEKMTPAAVADPVAGLNSTTRLKPNESVKAQMTASELIGGKKRNQPQQQQKKKK